ncbi:hypothetical protein FGIG_03284 [Fasciola gigantica]|uniref:Ig-like domain-containing protein n=1 Tax=Fasciola gigantica TaxID=46835 RepID=A0A504YWC8_FASGI|nr:hypothetical protein FGIG_03284 [Fasciola gigantica]
MRSIGLSLQIYLFYFLWRIPFGRGYYMCTTEKCKYVSTPPCEFDLGGGLSASYPRNKEGLFKMKCRGGQPYKTGWSFKNPNKYLDCSGIPSVIDLAKKVKSFRFCVYRLRVKTQWVSQMRLMEPFVFMKANCSIDPPVFPIVDGVLQISAKKSPSIGAAQVTCDEHSKRIYFLQSPDKVFRLWSNIRSMYAWLGIGDIKFQFRVTGRTVDGDVIGNCVYTTPRGRSNNFMEGILNTANQEEVGLYSVVCYSDEFHLYETMIVHMLNQKDCNSECTPPLVILDRPKKEPLNFAFCKCEEKFVAQFKDAKYPFDLDGSDVVNCTGDVSEDLNLNGSSFELLPDKNYPRMTDIHCEICWTSDKCFTKKTVLIIKDQPTREMKIELPTSDVYKITDELPEFQACIRWSDQNHCDPKLQAFAKVNCNLLNVTGGITSGQYSVKCETEKVNIRQVFQVNIYNLSDVSINCVPGPLILDKGRRQTVRLCGYPEALNSIENTLPAISCKSLPDGLPFTNGKAIIEPMRIYSQYYVVHCENATDGPVHIFIEDPPKSTLQIVSRINQPILVTELNETFKACFKWSKEKDCNQQANELLKIDCQSESVPAGSTLSTINCRSEPIERVQSFRVPVFDDRTLRFECIRNLSLIDRQVSSLVPLCFWRTEVPLPPDYTAQFPRMKINCSSDPYQLSIRDGNWLVHEKVPPIGAYKITCNRSADPILLFYIDNSVGLKSEPDYEYFIFGQYVKVEFSIDYPPFIPRQIIKPDQLNCTISTSNQSSSMDEGIWFDSGHFLVIEDLKSKQSHRGAHSVTCSDNFIRRNKTIQILHKSDFRLTVLEPVEPIIFPSTPKTFTCVLSISGGLSFGAAQNAHWMSSTTKGLVFNENRLLVNMRTPTGVYYPKCTFKRYGLELFHEIQFFVYKNIHQVVLEQVPSEKVVVLDENQPLVVRIRLRNWPLQSAQSLLDRESRNCTGTANMFNGTKIPIQFQNFIPFSLVPSGLLILNCMCRLLACAAKFALIVCRKNQVQLLCKQKITIDLEDGEVRQLICARRLEIPNEWATKLRVSRVIKVPITCNEPTGRLNTKDGYLLITAPYPPIGEYNVSCAEDTRLIPVYIYRRVIMLLPDQGKDFYFFSENSSVTFSMAYVDVNTHQIKFLNQTDLECLIRAPMHWDWKRIRSPYRFHKNRLHLNVSAKFRYSALYRVQCQLFEGVVERTTEVLLVNATDLRLHIQRPDRDQYHEGDTAVYICTLTGKPGLDVHAARNRPIWKSIHGGYVYTSNNTMVIDEKTASGRHELECMYESDGIRLNQTVQFTYFRSKDKLNIHIDPDEDPIMLTPNGALSVSLYWTFFYDNGSIVTHPENISYCNLHYPRQPDLTPVNFTRSIRFQWLTNGAVRIVCHSYDNKYQASVNRQMVKQSDFRLFCVKDFLVDLDVTTKFLVCKYTLLMQHGSDGDGTKTPKKRIKCKSLGRPLNFDEGVLLLKEKPAHLGYYNITCGEEKRNLSLFLYDSTLVLTDFPPSPFYVIGIKEKVTFKFGFLNNTKIHPVEFKESPVFCRFLNKTLKTVLFTGMTFGLQEIHTNKKHIPALVECAVFDGKIVRLASIDLLGMSLLFFYTLVPPSAFL